MKRIAIVGLAALMLLVAGTASAQICPLNGTLNNKLVCLIPQVYGPFGFGSTPNPAQSVLFTGDHHEAHFGSDFLSTFAPINEAVGVQVAQLPLASPSSGITFIYDPSLKTFAPSTDESLGPILGDRATTIGRHKLFLGFSYQYFNFSTIDGKSLGNIPTILQHQPFTPIPPNIPACPVQTGLTGTQYAGDPCFVRDYIQTLNNIDLTTNQYTIYLTYGITSRLDFSAAIPILDVRMAVTSQATIVPNSVAPASAMAPGNVWHSFNPINPALTAQCAPQVPCLNATFSDSNSAVGIGDVVLRGKYTVYKGERLAVAAGVDVRLPSGDAKNFLGSGTTGVEPFAVISYHARVTPHASVGYEVNGDSILAGTNIVPGATNPVAKGALPNRLLYIAGADVRVTSRLTGAFDLYGQRLFSSPVLISQTYTDHGNCSGPTNAAGVACAVYTPGTTHADIAQKLADENIIDASLGLKFRLWGHLVLTGNVLLNLDNGGLRSTAVPLVGISYTH
ncbi:MAG: transporter [Candidatus Acidiferrales bacterium]